MIEIEWITIIDFLLTPFIAGFLYLIAKRFRDKYYPENHPYRKFFLPALSFKIVGAIVICIIYAYYYRGGDTLNYFYHARLINSALSDSPSKWFNLLFAIPNKLDPNYYEIIKLMRWYGSSSSYAVPQFAAILGNFTLNTFVPTSMLFAAVSFTGFWALFVTFAKLYPNLLRPIATCILFIPSVALWGSGIFKDTLCMLALGWLCFSTFQFFIYRNRSLLNLTIFLGSFWLILVIKVYIIISFLPALIGWILFDRTSRIRNRQLAFIVNVFFLIGSGLVLYALLNQNTSLLGEFSFDNIVKTSEKTRNYISYVSNLENGSGYDLGEFSPGFSGFILKFPQAVNVTLFRPYLWETKKLIAFLNGVESLLLLFITLKIFFSFRIKNIIQSISSDYNIQFTLIFSIVFAFFVGVSTYNFGTLSRYKIPCVPFYLLTLVLIYYRNAKPGKRLLRFIFL
jgi:hypothetical protein